MFRKPSPSCDGAQGRHPKDGPGGAAGMSLDCDKRGSEEWEGRVSPGGRWRRAGPAAPSRAWVLLV
jgi:hypothetical protein